MYEQALVVFKENVKKAIFGLHYEFEISKYQGDASHPYTDEIVFFIPDGDKTFPLKITLAPTFACVHGELMDKLLTDEEAMELHKKVPQMYELQRERVQGKIAAMEQELARLKGLIGEQE